MVGIKETKEALVAINEVSILLCERFKDGIDVGDAVAIWDKIKEDEEFKAKMLAAYENYKLIPEEIKDIDFKEGSELVIMQIGYVTSILEALKK